MSVPFMLSAYDMRKYVDKWNEDWINEWERSTVDKNYPLPRDLLITLYTLGMDIAAKNDIEEIDIELHHGLHRSLDKSIQEDYFFIGVERLDKTWLKSGYASQEAILYTKDDSLTKELQRMAGQYDVNSEFKKSKSSKQKKKKEK